MSGCKLRWTPEMVEALREMRGRKVPLYLCAERIGVGYPASVYKARELGIANRMNRGRIPGEKLL